MLTHLKVTVTSELDWFVVHFDISRPEARGWSDLMRNWTSSDMSLQIWEVLKILLSTF